MRPIHITAFRVTRRDLRLRHFFKDRWLSHDRLAYTAERVYQTNSPLTGAYV